VIKRGKHPSRGPSAFLVGKVFDETGDRLTPSKSKKSSGRIIRYYYSNRLISGGADPTGWRLRADMLEQLLSDIVGQRLTEALTQFRLAPQMKPHAGAVRLSSPNISNLLRPLSMRSQKNATR
jgi:site-specific DNA recombinase